MLRMLKRCNSNKILLLFRKQGVNKLFIFYFSSFRRNIKREKYNINDIYKLYERWMKCSLMMQVTLIND